MKKLFAIMNVNENDVDFYKSIVEELKSCQWEKTDSNNIFVCNSVSTLLFYKMTAIDCSYFESKNIDYFYEIFYTKGVDNTYTWEVNFYEKQERMYSDYLVVENDDLGLFQAEEKPCTDWQNLLSNVLENALKETDVDSIVEFIDNNFADVSDKIRENLCDNLEVDDIGDVLKDDIARDWIERNSSDAYDVAVDNMDSYEIKDKIMDYLSDNL